MVRCNNNWDWEGILLGWRRRGLARRIGFARSLLEQRFAVIRDAEELEPILYTGDSHLMTFAPTGSGKGRGMIIPTLLSYPGSVVVIDPKGENYAVTARRRREMGQHVVVLDPFGKTTRGKGGGDRFNPFDIFKLPDTIVEADASMLAWQLAAGNTFSRDPFWDNTAAGLLYGLIGHVATGVPEPERNLNKVLSYLYADDATYQLAVLLDSGTVTCQSAHRELASYLALPERDTRPSVLATALSWIKALNMPCVAETLADSTFDLQDIVAGEPLSIYLCIPPEKLTSHKSLLRLWVSALLTAILRRTSRPEQRTLFILDECAQLGGLPLLEQAVTLLRGYGLQVWTFWQDLEQVRANYPQGYLTLINNSAILQAFGLTNQRMARELGDVLDASLTELMAMGRNESMLYLPGEGPVCSRRPDYINDDVFTGHWDPNPFFRRNTPPAA